MKIKIVIVLVLLMETAALSGCWNYKDIETVIIVAGFAIDKDKQTGDYIVTIELVDQQAGEKESRIKSRIIESKGYTIFDAVRNGIMKTGKKLLWGHCKIFIISQDVAREGVIPLLDFAMRDNEIRNNIWIVISTADTAGEILKTPVESHEIVSYYLNDMLKSVKGVSKYVTSEMTMFIDDISTKTTSAIAPAVNITACDNKTVPQIHGSAVFKQDKLVYFLNGDESKIVLMVKDDLEGGLLTLRETKLNANMKITLEIFDNKTKMKPVVKNNKIIMQIDIKMKVGIGELEGSVDFINKDKRGILKKDIESLLEKKINDLVKKTQYDFSTDIFDFDGTIQREMPDYWKKIESLWDEIYKDVEVRTKVEVDITTSVYSQKPIRIED